MNRFSKNLLTEWRRLNLPFADEIFIIAVSGGADSVGLLLALNELRERKKLRNRFLVAHFNHNLRGRESDADAEFVRGLTTKFNFEFVYKIPDPKTKIQNQTGNLEQNARRARYEFLTETATNLDACAVLTAHTLNDQAETFLLNLLRGSGLNGLGGMKPVRNLGSETESKDSMNKSAIPNPQSQIRLVRPLLNWAKREDTENFCLLNEIEFRYDSMNEDLAFNRVRIRKVLLPLLKDFNPKIIETLAKTAQLLRDDAEFLADNLRATDGEGKKTKTAGKIENLSLKDLNDVFPSVRRLLVREWLKDNRGNLRRLELKHIEAVEQLIFSRKSGKTVELPDGEIVLKQNGELHFQKGQVEK